MRRTSRKGSALVAVIWLLAVLSILIASYAVDAHLQTRVNIYLRERVTVDHLTEAGLAIAEVILTDYQNVSEASSDSDLEDKMEDDRWYQEKLTLKMQGEVSTGAIPVDALNAEGGTVSVTIRPIESKLNINNLYNGGDQKFGEIWMSILAVSGIPKDYWDGIVNGWCDWRDTDGTKTGDEGAESDFTMVLKDYPSFLYGYECRADVRDRLGKRRLAEEDRLVLLKAQLSSWGGGDSQKDDNADDEDDEDSDVRRKSDRNVKKYNRLVGADDDLALEGSEYAQGYRGKVQNRNIHVELLPLCVVTCYEKENKLTRNILYHHDIDDVNQRGVLPRQLMVTTSETALTEEQINFHFADIDEQTKQVAGKMVDDDDVTSQQASAIHWFARGLDFYLVQDFISAIADYSSAIAADGSLWMAYFNRAVARYKQAQIDGENAETSAADFRQTDVAAATGETSQYASYQLCLADLGKVIDLAPDFSYAWYDRANVFAMLHDYQAAIADYNEVIAMNPTFAEAYYNRGLTRLFLGQNEEGTADLSKAGELGLYGAYNLIKRFSE